MNTSKLNDLQISLLRLFQRDMSDEQILSLKRVMFNHYQELLKKEVDHITEEKGYSEKDFENMLNLKS
ncbi:MAG: hypothetical protein GW809_00245 [Bacteroidetes bacterium]|nr:hypothetical protein [Bacteroidota bacterium]NCQ10596.1 hypothetical protein [Bacteroidota bacterium]